LNIGQLARQKYGEDDVYLAGFAAYAGTVIAGEQWGAVMEEMEVPSARTGSIEARLHEQNRKAGYILFSRENDSLYKNILSHRAIGVVYDPQMEQFGNYVPSILSRRYNALIYFDDTRALHPLHLHPDVQKLPQTYPFTV